MIQFPTKKSKPVRDLGKSLVVCYGPSKIGKTGFWSHMDDTVWLTTEPGHDEVSIPYIDCHNYEEYREACGVVVGHNPKPKTIITDTYDALVTMTQDWVCRKHGVDHVSDIEHNRGYYFVTQELDRVITKMAQAFGLVFICNDTFTKVKTKFEEYDKHTLEVSAKNRSLILKKANYILLFSSCFNNESKEEERVIVTRGSKYYDAGHRGNFLPTTIPLDYEEFIKYFKEKKV